LGLQGKSKKDLEFNIKRPNGMIITTGPTGSGKTTTLYAILNELNDEATKIITMEDPIEYKLQGLNQSQVDSSKGYTFADGLKSILRQDPDIVMVGEIRDLETAEVAINAALTGHLMISTIHTNSAAGAIPRFLAMGVKPFLLAPSINAIMGQRLLRRLCKECKKEHTPEPETLEKVKKILSEISPASGDQLSEDELNNLKFYTAEGCDKCHGGYKGRVGVYEVLTMNEEVEQMILSGKVSETDAQNIATKSGMVTMVQDALLKAKDGITSIEEVFDKTE
ncbi:type II/IV secretion system protein, partial [Patescibacteria group bacterium]|nr:type II/IV secretion system protein [Patescibacteria group bacterium]